MKALGDFTIFTGLQSAMPLCAQCGEAFPANPNRVRKFCSDPCRAHFYRSKRSAIDVQFAKMPPGLRGAISELSACADLMERGFLVFRAVAPHGPYDVIAAKGRDVLRVEITTGTILADGRISYPRHERHAKAFDVIAVTTPPGSVSYFTPSGEPYQFEVAA